MVAGEVAMVVVASGSYNGGGSSYNGGGGGYDGGNGRWWR